MLAEYYDVQLPEDVWDRFEKKWHQCMVSIRPGIEPGIFRSVGGRLIHWANGPYTWLASSFSCQNPVVIGRSLVTATFILVGNLRPV
jgi:hypothetical protein